MNTLKKYVKYGNCDCYSSYRNMKRIIDLSYSNDSRFTRINLKDIEEVFVSIDQINKNYEFDKFIEMNNKIINNQKEYIQDFNLTDKVNEIKNMLQTVKEIVDNNKTGWMIFRKRNNQIELDLRLTFKTEKSILRIYLNNFEYYTYVKAKKDKAFNEYLLSILLRDNYYNNKDNYIVSSTNFNINYIDYY